MLVRKSDLRFPYTSTSHNASERFDVPWSLILTIRPMTRWLHWKRFVSPCFNEVGTTTQVTGAAFGSNASMTKLPISVNTFEETSQVVVSGEQIERWLNRWVSWATHLSETNNNSYRHTWCHLVSHQWWRIGDAIWKYTWKIWIENIYLRYIYYMNWYFVTHYTNRINSTT